MTTAPASRRQARRATRAYTAAVTRSEMADATRQATIADPTSVLLIVHTMSAGTAMKKDASDRVRWARVSRTPA